MVYLSGSGTNCGPHVDLYVECSGQSLLLYCTGPHRPELYKGCNMNTGQGLFLRLLRPRPCQACVPALDDDRWHQPGKLIPLSASCRVRSSIQPLSMIYITEYLLQAPSKGHGVVWKSDLCWACLSDTQQPLTVACVANYLLLATMFMWGLPG